MSVGSDLRAFLLSNTAVFQACNGRMHDRIAPEDTVTPYVVYEVSADDDETHLGGAVEMAQMEMQYHIHALTVDEVDVCSNAIRNVLHTFQGVIGETEIRSAKLTSVVHFKEEIMDGSNQVVFGVVLAFSIFHRKSVPVYV